ncbi:MAG: hypothetical protein ACYTET_07120 [Planctomycetota bacterium]
MADKNSMDLKKVKELVDLMKENDLVEVEISRCRCADDAAGADGAACCRSCTCRCSCSRCCPGR